MEHPALPLDVIITFTLVGMVGGTFASAVAGMLRAHFWIRHRPLPVVDPDEVQRLAGELRALASQVSALVKEEPAKAKEHAGVT